MAEEASKLVEETINAAPVVVFSKSYCPYCVKVKALFLDTLKVPADKIKIMELETRSDCADIQRVLKEITGSSTVPRVFIQGKSIGGCDDVHKLHNSNQLEGLLSSI